MKTPGKKEASAILKAAQPARPRGVVLVLSGPSGVGKGTVIRAVAREFPELVYAPSYTTRPRRRANVSEKKYFYVSEAAFGQLKKDGKLLEWANIYGHWYGLSREHVEKARQQGKLVVLEVDVQGAATLQKRGLEALYVFMLPPSLAELEHRLRLRGTEEAGSLKNRIQNMPFEIAQAVHYTYWLVNADPGQAGEDLKALVRSARLKNPAAEKPAKKKGPEHA